jgi:glutaredoxin
MIEQWKYWKAFASLYRSIFFSQSAMNPGRVVLYTRQGCCLCDEAQSLLARYGIVPERVDIDGDSALREKFTNCVPVLEIDGKVRFRGKVNEVLLRRILHSNDAATE